MIDSTDLQEINMIAINQVREAEFELIKLKQNFAKSNGWHKEEHQGFKGVEVYWCKDDVAISDIDDVIDLIEQSLGGE